MNAEKKAYQSIINLILSGEYSPGDFLLETDISVKLGMSRTPVSKALSMLVNEGFLNKMPKKGCYIPLPTPQDAEQVFYARKSVESFAAEAAALNASENEIIELSEIVRNDEVALSLNNKDLYFNTNEDFHIRVAMASHNIYIEKWVRNIFLRSHIYIFFFDSFYRFGKNDIPQKTPVQHRSIVEAIKERNPKKASELMKEHIEWTYTSLIQKI
ncbi:GntR family transcriptional regulator [Deferribacteraceae bacterium V6Fe1]|nr:GntR family transcriptional regulator [Deferribacteraceae bacterium V6Fe1]